MARNDYYPTERRSLAPTIALLAFLIGAAGTVYFGLPYIRLFLAAPPVVIGPAAPLAPTLAPAAIQQAQRAVPATAAEHQAIGSGAAPAEAAPLPPAAKPANAVPAQDTPAESFSPADLGWRPAPTPETTLSPEQYAASQASEEQNYLNSLNSTLTAAQRAVAEHDAQWTARTP